MPYPVKINSKNPSEKTIKKAAQILKNGGLVAFPTETVYGLGADGLNSKAVKKIFKAKKRPDDNPLILHVAKKEDLFKYVTINKKILKNIKKLINKFWPGPLTLILKKKKIIPDEVTANLKTVTIRLPDNKIAKMLIQELGSPIAAPSANLSGGPSPTSADHVYNDFKNKIDLILDGGQSKIGLESTVLDCTKWPFKIVRTGKVTPEDLKKELGEVQTYQKKKDEKTPISPGLKYKHYAPKAKLILIKGEGGNVKEEIQKLSRYYRLKKKRVGILNLEKNIKYKGVNLIKFLGKNNVAIAKNLFKSFREFDQKKIDIILINAIEESGLGIAIMNRIKKAAHKTVEA